MIAEELMVGDFVNYRKKPIRVEEILKKGIIGDKDSTIVEEQKDTIYYSRRE